MTVVDWKPSTEERDLILEAISILWDEEEDPARAKQILELRDNLEGAPEIG